MSTFGTKDDLKVKETLDASNAIKGHFMPKHFAKIKAKNKKALKVRKMAEVTNEDAFVR